jgi:vWA-MoxR associated protein C-terminal domain/vWA-MoxR associated protein middle region (VMAP-M) 8/Trypsin-like peptidase domain
VDSWQWRARVNTDTATGMTLGAGFLIDQRRLLTCAHIVSGLARVRVTFPGGAAGLGATVIPLTSWAKPGDYGDVALLQLDAPISAMPARFARPMGPYWVGELRACGFRRGFEQTGSYSTLRTAPDMTLGAEWWQVDVDPDRPERLAAGFSGAAVYLVSSGEVIGMISDADLAGGGLMARMLPLSALRRHWEELDDLLWLPWASQADTRVLREIVKGSVAPLRQIYLEAFPGTRPGENFSSVWDAIRYVAEERFEEDGLSCFLGRLIPHVSRTVAERLVSWSRQVLGTELSYDGHRGARSPASIIIRLERRTHGDSYELTLTSLVDGRPGHPTPAVEVGAGQVREEVERRLPELLGDVLGHDWMIEFALPESWLNRAVEEWKAGHTLMLAYPVVVRDVERLKPAFRQDRAIQRWVTLRKRATTTPEPVECANPRTKDQYFYWLTSREDICVLVHAEQPRRSHLTAELNAGIPVILWPRSKCSDEVHSECTGERLARELIRIITEDQPDDLPWRIRRLRAEARSQPSDQPHCGRRLTLLWDDPARLPDPPLMVPT